MLPAAVLPTAFNSGVNLLYLLGSLLLAYMLVAVAVGLFNMKGVRGEVLGDLRIEESAVPRLPVRLENPTRFAAYDLKIRPAWRHVRAPEAAVPRLEAGESTTAYTAGEPLARGVYPLDSFLIESPFPIGFMRTQRRFYHPAGRRRVVALPRLLEVDFQEAFGADQTAEGEDCFLHGVHGGASFYGVRPYRPGDPLKSMHWKAMARTRKLLVKEFQQPLQARYYLFLDLDESQKVDEGPEANLEYLVRLAASLGRHLAANQAIYHFIWFDAASQKVRVSEGFGAGADLDAARELLAGLRYHPTSAMRAMVAEAVHALTPGNRLVFFIPRDVATVPDDAAGAGFPSKAIFLVQSAAGGKAVIAAPETGLAGQVDLYRYSISEDALVHERR